VAFCLGKKIRSDFFKPGSGKKFVIPVQRQESLDGLKKKEPAQFSACRLLLIKLFHFPDANVDGLFISQQCDDL